MLPRKSMADQDCYYFFDEIPHASDWDKWIKTIYDMHVQQRLPSCAERRDGRSWCPCSHSLVKGGRKRTHSTSMLALPRLGRCCAILNRPLGFPDRQRIHGVYVRYITVRSSRTRGFDRPDDPPVRLFQPHRLPCKIDAGTWSQKTAFLHAD